MNKFNVGDTVFDLRFGFGVVQPKNEEKKEEHLYVQFNYAEAAYYLYYLSDGRPTITWFGPILLTLEEAAKLGYFPEKKKVKKKVKKTVDKWIILEPVTECALEVYNENPNDWTIEDDGFRDCIVVKTTLEWEVEE